MLNRGVFYGLTSAIFLLIILLFLCLQMALVGMTKVEAEAFLAAANASNITTTTSTTTPATPVVEDDSGWQVGVIFLSVGSTLILVLAFLCCLQCLRWWAESLG